MKCDDIPHEECADRVIFIYSQHEIEDTVY